MMDCGVHPGYTGLRSLPYLDTIDLSTVDLMLITHFHLDHCAAVPYVTSKTNFRVFPSIQYDPPLDSKLVICCERVWAGGYIYQLDTS